MKKKVFFRFFFQFFDAFLEILKSIYSKNRKLSQKPFKVVIMHYQNDRKMDSFSQTMLNHKSFEKRIIVHRANLPIGALCMSFLAQYDVING